MKQTKSYRHNGQLIINLIDIPLMGFFHIADSTILYQAITNPTSSVPTMGTREVMNVKTKESKPVKCNIKVIAAKGK